MAKFSDLRQELRDIIWGLTIRSEGRGAHFFTVHHARKDTHLTESSWPVNISTEGPKDYFPGTSVINFAAPRCGQDGSFSWILGNPSTYMEDSALWTTCWDSRRHMIRRFKPAETGRRILPEYSWERHREILLSDDATMTAVLKGDSGESQYFTIQPLRDLIIIETPPDSCISWDRAINDERFPPTIDDLWESLSWSAVLSWRWSRYGVVCAPRNVAINFDAKWLEQTEKYLRLFEGALQMEAVYTLWFVDHRLRRDPLGTELREHKDLQEYMRTFSAMGQRFVEVHRCDPGWDVWDEATNEFVKSKAFDFVDQLMKVKSLPSPWLRDEIYFPDFRVLACESL